MAPFPQKEPDFSQFLVREYFRFGSVERVLRHYHFTLPVSPATYQRILNRYGVVKTVGPNSRISEIILFFERFIKDTAGIESVYRKMPLSFQTSLKTIYRIYSYMKRGITRRVGVALVISPFNNPYKVLLAKDISTPSFELGKEYGLLSLPMGYSRKRDSRKTGVIRILQQEVFTDLVGNGNFPFDIVPSYLEPFMYLDIADVRVAVYSLMLPEEICSLSYFSSFKLKDYNFYDVYDIARGSLSLRLGVREAVAGYLKHLHFVRQNLVVNPLQGLSLVNKKLTSLVVDLEV
jgi:hypothetical protein